MVGRTAIDNMVKVKLKYGNLFDILGLSVYYIQSLNGRFVEPLSFPNWFFTIRTRNADFPLRIVSLDGMKYGQQIWIHVFTMIPCETWMWNLECEIQNVIKNMTFSLTFLRRVLWYKHSFFIHFLFDSFIFGVFHPTMLWIFVCLDGLLVFCAHIHSLRYIWTYMMMLYSIW